MKTIIKISIASIIIAIIGFVSYLFWPMSHTPVPADCECLSLDKDSGRFVPLHLDENNVYGIAMSYAGIIYQTGSEYNREAIPPVFRKKKISINKSNTVQYPNQKILLGQIEEIEPGMSKTLQEKFNTVYAKMDYEVELGIVLMEDVSREQLNDNAFSPRLGYFLANDLQSTTLAVLGSGNNYHSKYFDAKGSFPGFMPVSSHMWVPYSEKPDSTLCIDIKSSVNGELRQSENSKNRIYSNKEILNFILQKYNKDTLAKGTAIITGSPAGVANESSRWLRRLARLLNLDRITKLNSIFNAKKSGNKFLKPGDVVVIEGGPFEKIITTVID